MTVPGAKRLRSSWAWLRTRFSRRGLVLLYHRIDGPAADGPADVFDLCVDPVLFAEHLEMIRARATPLSLRQLCSAASQGHLPPKAVAVTFDDGYADFAHVARPLLERFEVPATVFAVSGGFGRSFWWDNLTDVLLSARSLPRELVLEIDGRRHRRAVHGPGPGERRRLLRSVHKLIRSVRESRPEAVVRQVVSWSGVEPRTTGLCRSLTSDELAELAASELFEIGCHTAGHASLGGLSEAAQRDEIAESKAALEAAVGTPVTEFSYPFGTTSDFDQVTVRLVERLGFTAACTNIPGIVTERTDRFRLPRLWAPNGGGAELARLLDHWLG